MKITESQLRHSLRSIISELLGAKKKTSFLEDMLGHGSGYGGGGYGGGGYDDYGYDDYGYDDYSHDHFEDSGEYGDDGDDGGDGDGE